MSEEILDITPTGGLYCVVPKDRRRAFDLSAAAGCTFADIASGQAGSQDECGILAWGMERLAHSAHGAGILRDLQSSDWRFAFDPQGESAARIGLDIKAKVISIPGFASAATFFRVAAAPSIFLCQLIKALRLAWQCEQGHLFRKTLSPRSFLLYRRIIEADADLYAMATAYQLRMQGDMSMWRSLIGSDIHLLASAFQECLQHDDSDDEMTDTMGAVFSDWFLDQDRLSQTDHESLNLLDQRMSSARETELTSIDILDLTMLPAGYSYLEYQAAEIAEDAFYARIDDPVNHRHLAQMLGERDAGFVQAIGFRDPELARKIFPGANLEIFA